VAERRQERVAHRMQAELGRLLLEEVKDPALHEVTVTAVRMTGDLRIARVYYRTLALEPRREAAARALARATPFLRGALGRALGLRVTPELRFEYDSTPDTARRLDVLLGAREPEESS
jgi:ribosome-binding factor A